jgi:hypothetical protein
MPTCVITDSVQVGESYAFVLVPVADDATCTNTSALLSGPELTALTQRISTLEAASGSSGDGSSGTPNLLTMSTEDGVVISGAIVTLWCIAWAIRAVRKAL